MRVDGKEVTRDVHLPGVWVSGGREDQYRKECEESRAGGWSVVPEREISNCVDVIVQKCRSIEEKDGSSRKIIRTAVLDECRW